MTSRFWGLPVRLAAIDALLSDSEELRVRKAVLVLSSTLTASLAFASPARADRGKGKGRLSPHLLNERREESKPPIRAKELVTR